MFSISCIAEMQSVVGGHCVLRWSTLLGKITWSKRWKSSRCCAIFYLQDLASLKKWGNTVTQLVVSFIGLPLTGPGSCEIDLGPDLQKDLRKIPKFSLSFS